MTRKQRKMLLRILLTVALLAVLVCLPVQGWWKLLLYLIPYLLIGYDVLQKAALGIIHGQLLDENFLMAVATLGALGLGVSYTGDYLEAVAVLLFYQVGELFQSWAVGKSRRSIAKLMDIRPEYANLVLEDRVEQTDPEEVAVGSVIRVLPGERIPLDGTVLEGESSVNTAALTGESLPREVSPGDALLSGCINLTGVLTVRTEKPYAESTVARILDLVENAASRKSRSEQFISRFARFYTPAVCAGALALALIPPIITALIWGDFSSWNLWLYRALTFLVISCPCALVISVPLTFFAAIGRASRAGILVKGSNYLESLSQVRTVALDKTGTLTCGQFRVVQQYPQEGFEECLLPYAAAAERYSPHPIAKGIVQSCQQTLSVEDVREHTGFGVTARVEGKALAVGKKALLRQQGIAVEEEDQEGAVYVAVDGQYAGWLRLADTLKPGCRESMEQLRRAGIRQRVLLTGDSSLAAGEVAGQLGLEQAWGDLLPEDKVKKVQQLRDAQPRGEKLAFVGDGINDAPVLSLADVGIAMGAIGSDAAIEAADVVLMDDDPAKLAKAVRLSRRCMAIVGQNIVFAIGVKLICLALGAAGIAGLWLAIFADVGVMVLAVLNAVRMLLIREEKL